MPEASTYVRLIKDTDIPQVVEIDREAFPGESRFRSYKSYEWDIKNPLSHYLVAYTEGDFPLQNHSPEKPHAEVNQPDKPRTPWFKRLLKLDRLVPRPRQAKALNLDQTYKSSKVGLKSKKRQKSLQKKYIVGFVGMWTMAQEAHIISIAVRNNYRGRGIGEKLLISLIDLAIQLKAHVVTLEVRASNEIAEALYRKYGFQVTGKRRGYYTDNGEDGVIMSTDIITGAPFQARFQELKTTHGQRWKEAFAEG